MTVFNDLVSLRCICLVSFALFLIINPVEASSPHRVFECFTISASESPSSRVITLRISDANSFTPPFGTMGRLQIVEKQKVGAGEDWDGKLETGQVIRFKEINNLPGFTNLLEIVNPTTGGRGTFPCKPKSEQDLKQTSVPLSITTLEINKNKTNNEQVDRIKANLISPAPHQAIEATKRLENEIISTRQFQGNEVNLITDSRHLRLQNILYKILTSNGIDATKWNLRLLETKPVTENAFVTGGTTVFVFTGISDNARSDDEIAFILGHEVAHTLLKHITRVDNELASLFSTITAAAAMLSKREGRRERLQFASNFVSSSYSREHEREADALGIFLATKAGYNASHSIQFFMRSQQIANNNRAQDESTINQYVQQANQLAANCETQKSIFYSSPQYQTKQNAIIVNQVCGQAQEVSLQVDRVMKDYQKDYLKSMMTRTHPIDTSRIRASQRVLAYIECKINEEGLEAGSAEFNVIWALSPFRSCR